MYLRTTTSRPEIDRRIQYKIFPQNGMSRYGVDFFFGKKMYMMCVMRIALYSIAAVASGSLLSCVYEIYKYVTDENQDGPCVLLSAKTLLQRSWHTRQWRRRPVEYFFFRSPPSPLYILTRTVIYTIMAYTRVPVRRWGRRVGNIQK